MKGINTSSIKHYKIGKKIDYMWYNYPVDVLDSDTIRNILTIHKGSGSSYSNVKNGVESIKKIIGELKIKPEPCCCELCVQGLPDFINLSYLDQLPDTYLHLTPIISISIYSITNLIKNHIITKNEYKSLSNEEKEKLDFIKNNYILHYMNVHRDIFKINSSLFQPSKSTNKKDLRQYVTNCLFNQSGIFKTGKLLFNGSTGFWALTKGYNPFLKVQITNNPSLEVQITNNSESGSDIGNSKRCGGIGISGKICEHLGRCHHHFSESERGIFKSSSSLSLPPPTEDNSNELNITLSEIGVVKSTRSFSSMALTVFKPDDDVSPTSTIKKQGQLKRIPDNNNQIDQPKKKLQTTTTTTTTSPIHSKPTKTSKIPQTVVEWEKKILEKTNFFSVVKRMNGFKGFNLSREFARFIALKIVYNTVNIIPGDLIEIFWRKFILDTSSYRKFFIDIGTQFIDYDPSFYDEKEEYMEAMEYYNKNNNNYENKDKNNVQTTPNKYSKSIQPISNFKKTCQLYKLHFNLIDDEIWVRKDDN